MRRIRTFWRARARWQRIALVLGALATIFAGAIYVWLLRDLPSIDDLEAGMALPSTRILDRDGRLLYQIADPATGINHVIALDDLPASLAQATIATEDENFYRHPGVDVEGIARALWINARGGEVVGEGWHRRQGEAHAEVLALEAAGERARGATLYVTLEPCSHHGKTPPCTDAIVAAGIRRVVIAAEDPNIRAAGGAERLRRAGIEVTIGDRKSVV